jgi:transposase
VNGLGLPVKVVLTAGQAADVTQAETRIDGVPFEVVIGDNGYDSQSLVGAIQRRGGEAVIPSRANRTTPRVIDRHMYTERNVVERFRAKVKQYRRVAIRDEKTGRNFLGFLHVASILILLR